MIRALIFATRLPVFFLTRKKRNSKFILPSCTLLHISSKEKHSKSNFADLSKLITLIDLEQSEFAGPS